MFTSTRLSTSWLYIWRISALRWTLKPLAVQSQSLYISLYHHNRFLLTWDICWIIFVCVKKLGSVWWFLVVFSFRFLHTHNSLRSRLNSVWSIWMGSSAFIHRVRRAPLTTTVAAAAAAQTSSAREHIVRMRNGSVSWMRTHQALRVSMNCRVCGGGKKTGGGGVAADSYSSRSGDAPVNIWNLFLEPTGRWVSLCEVQKIDGFC